MVLGPFGTPLGASFVILGWLLGAQAPPSEYAPLLHENHTFEVLEVPIPLLFDTASQVWILR